MDFGLDLAPHLPYLQFANPCWQLKFELLVCPCVSPMLRCGFLPESLCLGGNGLTWTFRFGFWTSCVFALLVSCCLVSWFGRVRCFQQEDMCVCTWKGNPSRDADRIFFSHNLTSKSKQKWCVTSSFLLWHGACKLFHHVLSFDATLGFPGEGPSRCHSIVSMNLGSIMTNTLWHTFDCTALCTQETRIGKNNIRHAQKSVESTGKMLFPGQLLPGFIQKNGKHRTAHGGTAILAPQQTTQAFNSLCDVTGLYQELLNIHRCNAVWLQVTRRIKALVFSVYCQTGASSDQLIHDKNDDVLQKIFLIASQFGDIPIIVAGDFQDQPLHYESISRAINFHHWYDPLTTIDDDGCLTRPLTFSLDGLFSGAGDNCSCIDGMLLNKVAFSALEHMSVVEIAHVQHRPTNLLSIGKSSHRKALFTSPLQN